MSGLAAYERLVAAQLGRTAGPPLGGGDVTRWAVAQWALTAIRDLCPLTSTLLDLRGELDPCVERHRTAGPRPMATHAFARGFLRTMTAYDDRLVADVALLELAITAPTGEPVTLPDPWLWTVDPRAVVVALTQGVDPAVLPRTDPLAVRRAPDGTLTVDSRPRA